MVSSKNVDRRTTGHHVADHVCGDLRSVGTDSFDDDPVVRRKHSQTRGVRRLARKLAHRAAIPGRNILQPSETPSGLGQLLLITQCRRTRSLIEDRPIVGVHTVANVIVNAIVISVAARAPAIVMCVIAPPLVMDKSFEGSPPQPSGFLQHGAPTKRNRYSNTQVGNRLNAGGQLKSGAEYGGLYDAHPTHTEPFGASREPKVLNGATNARADGFRLRGRSQNGLAAGAQIDGNAKVERRLQDPFEPKGQVLGSPTDRKAHRLGRATAKEAIAHARASCAIAHDDKTPWLRKPNARGKVRRTEHTHERLVVDIHVLAKMAYVAPHRDDVVDGAPCLVGKASASIAADVVKVARAIHSLL